MAVFTQIVEIGFQVGGLYLGNVLHLQAFQLGVSIREKKIYDLFDLLFTGSLHIYYVLGYSKFTQKNFK